MMQRLVALTLVLLVLVLGTGCMEAGTALYERGTEFERKQYGFDEKQINIGPLTINYYEGGKLDGPPVVLIHGFSADRNNWPRFAKNLTDQYHVLIPDLAGHGKSTWNPDWDYSPSAQADRVAGFIRLLGLESAHVAGNSMGGAVTTHLALRHPQRVRSIALLDAAGVTSPNPSPMAKQLQQGKNPFLIEKASDFRAFWTFSMQQPPYLPDFIIDALGQRYVDNRERLARIFADLQKEPPADAQLANIKTPTLVLWGQEDRLLDVSMAHVYANGIPDAQLVILEDIGHLPMVESPRKSAEIYLAFLRRAQAG